MSQTSEMDDDLRPEYDFTQLSVVARGQGRKQSSLTVQLDPDRETALPSPLYHSGVTGIDIIGY